MSTAETENILELNSSKNESIIQHKFSDENDEVFVDSNVQTILDNIRSNNFEGNTDLNGFTNCQIYVNDCLLKIQYIESQPIFLSLPTKADLKKLIKKITICNICSNDKKAKKPKHCEFCLKVVCKIHLQKKRENPECENDFRWICFNCETKYTELFWLKPFGSKIRETKKLSEKKHFEVKEAESNIEDCDLIIKNIKKEIKAIQNSPIINKLKSDCDIQKKDILKILNKIKELNIEEKEINTHITQLTDNCDNQENTLTDLKKNYQMEEIKKVEYDRKIEKLQKEIEEKILKLDFKVLEPKKSDSTFKTFKTDFIRDTFCSYKNKEDNNSKTQYSMFLSGKDSNYIDDLFYDTNIDGTSSLIDRSTNHKKIKDKKIIKSKPKNCLFGLCKK